MLFSQLLLLFPSFTLAGGAAQSTLSLDYNTSPGDVGRRKRDTAAANSKIMTFTILSYPTADTLSGQEYCLQAYNLSVKYVDCSLANFKNASFLFSKIAFSKDDDDHDVLKSALDDYCVNFQNNSLVDCSSSEAILGWQTQENVALQNNADTTYNYITLSNRTEGSMSISQFKSIFNITDDWNSGAFSDLDQSLDYAGTTAVYARFQYKTKNDTSFSSDEKAILRFKGPFNNLQLRMAKGGSIVKSDISTKVITTKTSWIPNDWKSETNNIVITNSFIIPVVPNLVKDYNTNKLVNLASNFNLSFKITPIGIKSSSSGILEFEDILGGALGIKFNPNSHVLNVYTNSLRTNLTVRMYVHQSFTANISLTQGITAQVTLNVSGRSIKLYLNNSIMIGDFLFSNDIITGSTFLYVSPPSMAAASANFICDYTQELFQSNPPAINLANLKEVSSKFAISFNITPNGAALFTLFDRREVFDNKIYRIPAIWLTNSGFSVRVPTGANTIDNDGITNRNMLPIGSKTNVRIEIFNQDYFIFLNNTLDRYSRFDIPPNISTFFIDEPSSKYPISQDLISPIKFENISSKTLSLGIKNGPIFQQGSIDYVDFPLNYRISLIITPSGTETKLSNILQYTINQNGDSYLAMNFPENSTRLQITIRTKIDNGFFLISNAALPIGYPSSVTLEVINKRLILCINSTWDTFKFFNSDRIAGQSVLYVSDRGIIPAKVSISDYSMTGHNGPSLVTQTSPGWVFKGRKIAEGVVVTRNYKISFTIIPLQILSPTSPTGIIRYGQLPNIIAVMFQKNSTLLRFYTGTKNDSFANVRSNVSLPMGYPTLVTFTAIGQVITISLNNTFNTSNVITGSRFTGTYDLFASDPWYPKAGAFITPPTMIEII